MYGGRNMYDKHAGNREWVTGKQAYRASIGRFGTDADSILSCYGMFTG